MDERERCGSKESDKGLSLGSKLKRRKKRDIMRDLISANLNREREDRIPGEAQ